jgi:hypothetical protein
MKILFINNDGGGFADHIQVEPGVTVAALFSQRLPDRDANDYSSASTGSPPARIRCCRKATGSA